jgi:hypothetical protein
MEEAGLSEAVGAGLNAAAKTAAGMAANYDA